jgi:hypothetical protein
MRLALSIVLIVHCDERDTKTLHFFNHNRRSNVAVALVEMRAPIRPTMPRTDRDATAVVSRVQWLTLFKLTSLPWLQPSQMTSQAFAMYFKISHGDASVVTRRLYDRRCPASRFKPLSIP